MNVLIIGGGPTGAQLADFLMNDEKINICLVENHREVLQRLHQELPTEIIYEDNPMDLQVLEHAGIREANVLVACTSNDADNVVLCYLAQKLFRVPRTIGRINNPRHAWMFTDQLHVDVALNESSILAHLIQEEMSLGDMMTLLKLRRGQYSLVEVVIPPGASVVGKRIMDIPLPEKCVISAIFRKGETILPRGSTVLEVGDEVLVTTDAAGEEKLENLFEGEEQAKSDRV